MPKAIGVLQGERAKVDEFLREFQSTLKPGESVTVKWENELVTLTPEQIERLLENAATNGNVHVWSERGRLVVLWPNPAFEAYGVREPGSSCSSGKVVGIVIEMENGELPKADEEWRWRLIPSSISGAVNLPWWLLIGPDPNASRPGLTEQDIDVLTADPARAEYFERVVHGIPDGEAMRRCAECRKPLGPTETLMFNQAEPEKLYCVPCGRSGRHW